MVRKYCKVFLGFIMVATLFATNPFEIKAQDIPADVLAVQQLLQQQQEICAKQQEMLQKQAAQANPLTAQTIAADQQVEALSNAQNLQAYQAALLLQYQQAAVDQYAKALFIQQALAKQQVSSFEHTLLLNAVQAMQKAQYTSMVQNGNFEYAQYLLDAFAYDQNATKLPVKAYEGLK